MTSNNFICDIKGLIASHIRTTLTKLNSYNKLHLNQKHMHLQVWLAHFSKDWFRYVNNWNSIQDLGDGKSITVWIGYSIDVDKNVCCWILIWYWLPAVGLKEIMLTWTAKRILASYTYIVFIVMVCMTNVILVVATTVNW